ncbi:MAG: hypothetical protein U0670_20575 [Anaerolineae bacterium]
MTLRNAPLYEEARRLRREGIAMKKIAKDLGVAIGTLHGWVKDIQLTEEQVLKLKANRRERQSAAQAVGNHRMAEKYRDLRRQYQEAGRAKAREKDPLHIAGCMLYWAEGGKSRNNLCLINSDPDMLIFYMRFLTQSLQIPVELIKLRISCYTNNGLALGDIERYWLDLLRLPAACLGKSTVNVQPRSSQQRGRKLLYGVCEVGVYRTQYLQHVLGAIQEYIGIDKPEWLM